MAAPRLDHDAILAAVRLWPREARLALARDNLDAALFSEEHAADADTPQRIQGNWRNLVGLLVTDQPPPTDDDIAR